LCGHGQGGIAGSGGAGAGLPAGGYGGQLVGGNVPGMIDVASVTFWMGCNDDVDTQCDSDEAPYHQITLSAYSIDETEVTRGAYAQCVDAGYCATPPCDYSPTGPLVDHPVTCVTWADAHRYCDFAGKRLPTEAEWELAARGTTGSKFPWGDTAPTCTLANMNTCSNDTHPVGSHATGQSPLGALDMAGNVQEWVADFYRHEYYETSPSTDPTGPPSGPLRVLRGGAWDSATFDVRASNRDAALVTHFGASTGFRCAL
ncbi:MAG: formylglycine-generating enzyme family protein, partial [Deltaproteobacteria bacterium]|nr:formylglycine-generating enzyme family protein [Deltaproteobacteria bacterium]MBW2534876.1 formylglycine-generating enzyme family protein [Deltaproteobacteria bacterium]